MRGNGMSGHGVFRKFRRQAATMGEARGRLSQPAVSRMTQGFKKSGVREQREWG
jgi:hypothetical protein